MAKRLVTRLSQNSPLLCPQVRWTAALPRLRPPPAVAVVVSLPLSHMQPAACTMRRRHATAPRTGHGMAGVPRLLAGRLAPPIPPMTATNLTGATWGTPGAPKSFVSNTLML